MAPGWTIELALEAPRILYPTAIVAAPDGTIYLGQDPMDMPGPPTEPIDSVVAIKDGKVTVFADKLWSVMGLEWVDGTLYVVHAPFLSAFRDTDGDGKADERVDLITGLGPKSAGLQRDQRPHRLGHPAGDGRVPLHRGRRQGDPARASARTARRSSSTAAA